LIEWRDEVYPKYLTPFIWLDGDKPNCGLAQFGLVLAWAADKPSYRNAWKKRQFGLAIMQSFYEPNYASGKAVRWRIKRADASPIAVASIWDRFVDHETGEIVCSFSMITINATGHPIMQQFHGLEDEKRSIVVLQDNDYLPWLKANHEEARSLLKLAPDGFLDSESAPR
jgi:putative SOS response-associated peptidase YedK